MKRCCRIWCLIALTALCCSCGVIGRTPTKTIAPDEEFCIENLTVQDYMANANSVLSAGGASYLTSSTFQSLRGSALANGYRNDQPRYKRVLFDNSGLTDVKVTMTADGVDVLNVTAGAESGYYDLQNMVPGKLYSYRIADASDARRVLAQGSFLATGQLRMIRIDHGWNIRDLGGWTGWGGHKVRYEQIYRGGSLGGMNKNGETYSLQDYEYAELDRIGIRAHLDLRSEQARGAWPNDATRNSYTFGRTPLIAADAAFVDMPTDYGLLRSLVNPSVVGDIAFIIQSLKAGKPVYFHCRTGADRTGAVGMAVLGLLGCGDTQTAAGGNPVALDYDLTSLGMDEEGTIHYNETGTFSGNYSNRSMSGSLAPRYGYDFFRNMVGMNYDTLQDKIYYYLNRHFIDNPVNGMSIGIGKADLDWFINYMLNTNEFVGPSWANDGSSPSLDENISRARELRYHYR